MSRVAGRRRAWCPYCPRGHRRVRVKADGCLWPHGPVRDRCWGTGLDTADWREAATRQGPVLVPPPGEGRRY